ncbi:hypothetical protein HRbin17_01668 [bacterium HR17]|uniref:HEAT repeat domain-containing protein n=1 Tax=Candidatus Fervidibacter japonicus TaxID=2035412 RepID=A0A2H5XDD4_9BACT|nr:hypothetical protein HRbin17_01668 [bacterium HR17]
MLRIHKFAAFIVLVSWSLVYFGFCQQTVHRSAFLEQAHQRLRQMGKLRQWGIKGEKEKIPELIRALREGMSYTKVVAAKALARLRAEEALEVLKEEGQKLSKKAWSTGLGTNEMHALVSITTAVARIEAMKSGHNPSRIVKLFLDRCGGISLDALNRSVMGMWERVLMEEYVLILRELADLIATMRQAGYDERALSNLERSFNFHLDYPCKLKLELSKIKSRQRRVNLLVQRILSAKSGTRERYYDVQALADEGGDDVREIVSKHLLQIYQNREKVKEYWRIEMLLHVFGALGDPKALPVVRLFLNDPNQFVRTKALRVEESLRKGEVFPVPDALGY